MPRDTSSETDLQIVKKRWRRLTGIDEYCIVAVRQGDGPPARSPRTSPSVRATESKDNDLSITNKVVEDMAMSNRPLEPVYPVVFIDAIDVKIRDGQVANRPIYVAIGVTVRRGARHPRAVGRRPAERDMERARVRFARIRAAA